MKCVVCGKERLLEGEGRIIDGSVEEDAFLLGTEYFGSFICSHSCYVKALLSVRSRRKEKKKKPPSP